MFLEWKEGTVVWLINQLYKAITCCYRYVWAISGWTHTRCCLIMHFECRQWVEHDLSLASLGDGVFHKEALISYLRREEVNIFSAISEEAASDHEVSVWCVASSVSIVLIPKCKLINTRLCFKVEYASLAIVCRRYQQRFTRWYVNLIDSVFMASEFALKDYWVIKLLIIYPIQADNRIVTTCC